MPLTAGTRVGHYEILAPIGAGGMGEVYRARDPKLQRDVAIKLLPDAFAADADRMARFTREALVLASLNHPNIAAIYGVEDCALVMELVQGDAGEAHRGRSAPAERDTGHCAANRRGPGGGARARCRASGSETGECQSDS